MTELVLGVFAGKESTAEVLRDLRRCNVAADSVASAGTVSVGPDGSYAAGTTDRPGSGCGFSGVFWEGLFGLVFFVHVPGSSYGPTTGAVFEAVSHTGADECFRARAREALRPGSCAVGLLLQDEDVPRVLALLAAYGARLVRTSLTPAQDAELGRELGRTP